MEEVEVSDEGQLKGEMSKQSVEVTFIDKRGWRRRSHGHALRNNHSAMYKLWSGMIQRCRNPGHRSYKDYGGRGIKVCERWQKFENFLADMGERPEGTSLDRFPNNDGDYEPGNCRWATWKEQSKNKRVSTLPRKRIDLTGQRFGRLVAIRIFNPERRKETFWECKCDCGNIGKHRASLLRNGHTKSCGCSRGRDALGRLRRKEQP